MEEENYHFYILKNSVSNDKQNLKTGTTIMRVPKFQPINFTDGEGPFNSLRGIKRNSLIYKSLKQTNLKRAQQIILDKNITKPESFIATPKGMEFHPEIIEAFTHAVGGKIHKENVSGVHFYNPKKVKILEVIEKNEINSIFIAKFEFYDAKNNKWMTKNKPSSFFPKDWNLSQLLQELKFAYDQIDKEKLEGNLVRSKTLSNIDVEIVFQNQKLKTIYPII